MQGHGSTCDCTFNVLLHIDLCVCFAFFMSLPGKAFYFASHTEISVGSPVWCEGPNFSILYHLLSDPLSPLTALPLFFSI